MSQPGILALEKLEVAHLGRISCSSAMESADNAFIAEVKRRSAVLA